jgi:hypothetical protein
MKITTATYGGTFATGHYQNQKLSLSAQLEDGDTPETVIAALKTKVAQLAGPTIADMHSEQHRLQRTLYTLRQKTAQAQQEWTQLTTFLTTQGLKPDLPAFPDLPLLLPASSDAEFTSVKVQDYGQEESQDPF